MDTNNIHPIEEFGQYMHEFQNEGLPEDVLQNELDIQHIRRRQRSASADDHSIPPTPMIHLRNARSNPNLGDNVNHLEGYTKSKEIQLEGAEHNTDCCKNCGCTIF